MPRIRKYEIRIQYNSPVVLTFALLSLIVLGLGALTNGYIVSKYFCVYTASLADPFTYLRFFTHVLGHADMSHYLSNMLLILIIGPSLEEKHGQKNLILAILFTALISGLVQFVFFPSTALLGASGIVFMMISMSSLAGMRSNCIPITLICVFVFYLINELFYGIFSSVSISEITSIGDILQSDNISQITHIIGGICGAIIGYAMYGK